MNEKKIEEEFRLALKMKDLYCDESGKEINPKKAAEIIHKLGLIYRKRSPDKISLIKSAGLFNAAIFRNPSAILEIRADLSELCQHTLQLSNAKIQNADLVKQSALVKVSINNMREEINMLLKASVPKIPSHVNREDYQKLLSNKVSAVQRLNKAIAKKYTKIMADISVFCEGVMGKPPCEYAVVGMGSLAREEITPYSDFEHIILLNDDKRYKSYLEYFRWFSVIFHIIILNLQETIIPSLNIYSLNGEESKLKNWYYDFITPRGISFDGLMPHACKFPLGRQQHTKNKPFVTELIKPINEMISEANLKHGYHLADILTRTSLVFGNKSIFDQFLYKVQEHQDKQSLADTVKHVRLQVKDDLNKFSTRFQLTELKTQSTINIKQLMYRSITIFVLALGRLHKIFACSCFDIVDKMANTNKITHNTANKLRCAISIACEMRLKVYMNKKSQCDTPIDLRQNGPEKCLRITGETCTINYFQIAYCLQCELAKCLGLTKLRFYSHPLLINVAIGLTFGISRLTNVSKLPQISPWYAKKFNFDACIELLEAKANLSFSLSDRFSLLTDQSHAHAEQIKYIANTLKRSGIYDEAIELYKYLLRFFQRKTIQSNRDCDIAWAYHQIGQCLSNLNMLNDALTYLSKALDTRLNITSNAVMDRKIGFILNNIGYTHIHLHNYNEALTYLNLALEIDQNVPITLNPDLNIGIAITFQNIGHCHAALNNYDEALKFFNQTLKIRQNTTGNTETSMCIAEILHEIGTCYLNFHNYNDALKNLSKALKIKQKLTLNAEKDRIIAVTLNSFGCCQIDLQNYDRAWTYFCQARTIYHTTTLDKDVDRDLAISISHVGRCLIYLQRFDQSWFCLEQSLKIFQKTTVDEKKDRRIADIFSHMGDCLLRKQEFSKALIYLQRSLKIYQTVMANERKNTKLAKTLQHIGFCFMELEEYSNALNYLKKSLKIYQSFFQNEYIECKLETVRSKVDQCFNKLGGNI